MMRQAFLIILILGAMLCGSVWAATSVQVEQIDGKTLIHATATRLAAWRPVADGLVVVVPADSGSVEIGNLPDGVTADKVLQNGLTGVVVHGVTNSWQVVQDGANWLIRPGSGLKAESVLMLRDGWHVGSDTLHPQPLDVLGKSWQVALVNHAQSVAGSVAGVVRLGSGVAMQEAPVEASVPVAKALPEAKIEAKLEPKVTVPQMVAQPLAQVVPVAPARLQPVGDVALRAVPMMAAAPLKALGQPTMASAELPEHGEARGGLQAMKLSEMLARIEPAAGPAEVSRIQPLALPSGTLPSGLGRVAAVTRTVPVASGLGRVAVHPAPAVRPIGIGGVQSELLPQLLGDIYMPGTVISLTLPAPAKVGNKTAAGEVAEVVSSGEPVVMGANQLISEAAVSSTHSTWNQVSMAPMVAQLAAEKISASTASSASVALVAPVLEAVQPQVRELPVAAGAADRILPTRGDHYLDDVSDAMQAIAEAPADSTRARDGQMYLAGLYLAWQRPEEALAVLGELPQRADRQPGSPQARLYMALAQLAKGEAPDTGLLDLGGPLGNHGKLWQAVAASRAGDYGTALKLWPKERGILPQYPAYLRELAQQAQATALVMVGDRKVATKVIDELVDGYVSPTQPPVALERLRGLVRLGTPDESKGLEYLATAAEDMRDPAQAYRAKFEFVRALQQRHDLSKEQVRKYLTDLWFDWRGDDLEREVLETLADLYDKANQPREALEYWQTLVRAYPHAPDLNGITERMTEAFLRVFDPENPKIYDTLSYIGLYYDFSELVPNDARGDIVQEQIARLLTQANLWKRAVPILEQQLDHRPLDPAAQGRLALMLASAYGHMGNAADGIKLLDKWQRVATTSVLAREWKLAEYSLLMQLNRPDSAAKELAGLPDDDAEVRNARIEATWAAQDWSGSVPLLQAKLAHMPADYLVSDTGAQLATFRLGYAYGQLRDAQNLDGLTKRFAPGLNHLPQLADDMGAVAAGTGVSASVVAAGPLAPLTGAMNDINRLTDRIQELKDTMMSQRKEQKEYDDKMRYMDLLPPPAI